MKANKRKDGTPVRSSRPDGYLKAGVSIQVHLTPRQLRYSQEAAGIARLCYNLALDTHRFCRFHRMPWPSAADMRREFNSMKPEHFPYAKRVSKCVSQDAFANFAAAMTNWRDPKLPAGPPSRKTKRDTPPAY